MTLACTGNGVGATQGVAIGEAFVLQRGPIKISPRSIHAHQIEAEIERFYQATRLAQEHLRAIQAQIPLATSSEISAFIDTHLLMLEDSALTEGPAKLIRSKLYAAEWALQLQRDMLVQVFDEMDDPYLRTRRDDVDHVVHQIQKQLLHANAPVQPLAEMDLTGRIIVAHDLTPADTLVMRHQGIGAFVTEFGSPMSHTAIMARSLGIPAVIGVPNVTQLLRNGETLVVDGERGVILADADESILDHYRQRMHEFEARRNSLRALLREPSVTQDGKAVSLMANIELPEDIHKAIENGADGVGLYRTEFLYMNRESLPEEEEQLETYLSVVRGLNGIPLTIRTLDIGADKQAERQSPLGCPPVNNPALGLRAIRLCLNKPELFTPQIRAILRVSAEGPVRIMIPMLSNLRELIEVRSLIEDTKTDLRAQGLRFDAKLPIGGMIEVPAAALSAAAFARNLDFLSIGTNDLVQYTLAVDRMDDEVNYLFDPLNPGVLQLILLTINAARAQGIPVSMCGEMAGDPQFVRLLLGLGLREFSMQPTALLEVKRIIRTSDTAELAERTARVLANIHEMDAQQILGNINAGFN